MKSYKFGCDPDQDVSGWPGGGHTHVGRPPWVSRWRYFKESAKIWWIELPEWVHDTLLCLKVLLLLAISLFLLGLLVVLLVTPLGLAECNVKAQSFPHFYDWSAGCMVQVNDIWVPLKNLLVTPK